MGQTRQYLRNLGERGVSSVEFAIVGPVFVMLLLGIFELGSMVFVQSVLDSSARQAARLIRTGQAQNSGNTQTFFQTNLCNTATSVIGCGNLIYQVQTLPNWSAAQTAVNTPPVRDPVTGKLIPVPFNGGTCSSSTTPQIVAVQVTYDYKFFTMWIGQLLGDNNQSAFLISTVIFQNEPYCSGNSLG
jgi:Flp pilus assembly protein TadG